MHGRSVRQANIELVLAERRPVSLTIILE